MLSNVVLYVNMLCVSIPHIFVFSRGIYAGKPTNIVPDHSRNNKRTYAPTPHKNGAIYAYAHKSRHKVIKNIWNLQIFSQIFLHFFVFFLKRTKKAARAALFLKSDVRSFILSLFTLTFPKISLSSGLSPLHSSTSGLVPFLFQFVPFFVCVSSQLVPFLH